MSSSPRYEYVADSRVVTGHHSGSGGRRLQLQDQGHSLSYIAETGSLKRSRLDVEVLENCSLQNDVGDFSSRQLLTG